MCFLGGTNEWLNIARFEVFTAVEKTSTWNCFYKFYSILTISEPDVSKTRAEHVIVTLYQILKINISFLKKYQ